jgi:transcriptional antiterminator NusG
VKAYIETEIRLEMGDYVSSFVPTEKVVTVKMGKNNQRQSLFSGYVMIEANLIGEIPHIIKSITSVIGF